jgi:hypothetical protein
MASTGLGISGAGAALVSVYVRSPITSAAMAAPPANGANWTSNGACSCGCKTANFAGVDASEIVERRNGNLHVSVHPEQFELGADRGRRKRQSGSRQQKLQAPFHGFPTVMAGMPIVNWTAGGAAAPAACEVLLGRMAFTAPALMPAADGCLPTAIGHDHFRA